MAIQFCVMTPDRVFLTGSADELILPTNSGQMGILTNHAPLVTGLDVGAMFIRNESSWSAIALMGGFALVQQNQMTVLANEAQASDTIDTEEAQKRFHETKLQLEQAQGQKQRVEANAAFKRARALYQVIQER